MAAQVLVISTLFYQKVGEKAKEEIFYPFKILDCTVHTIYPIHRLDLTTWLQLAAREAGNCLYCAWPYPQINLGVLLL